MAAGKNQHYVPKFYFRLFNGGRPTICAFMPKAGDAVLTASIKSQCKANYLYGDAQLEAKFSEREGLHATALRHLIQIARDPDGTPCNPELVALAYEAVLFQRARTELEAIRHIKALETLADAVVIEHLESQPQTVRIREMIDAIREGSVRLHHDPKLQAISNVWNAINAVPVIQDLRMRILVNTTKRPFIFSDAPVAFYNDTLSRIAPWRAMGVCSRGLQVFMPLNSISMVMLSDLSGCSGAIMQSDVIDLQDESDVAQLNALQFHSFREVVYFGNPRDELYVSDLWRSHRRSIQSRETSIDLNREDGRPVLDTFMTIVPHPNIRLRLSFVKWCESMDDATANTPRNQELYDKYSQVPTWAQVSGDDPTFKE